MSLLWAYWATLEASWLILVGLVATLEPSERAVGSLELFWDASGVPPGLFLVTLGSKIK